MATIVLAADESYLPYIPCNLAQLGRFGRKADGVVLIAPPTLDRRVRTCIESAAAASGVELMVRIAPELDQLYQGALTDDYWHMSVSKLFLADLLPDFDDVLYLDVDTLIRASLDELLAWELRHPLGGVAELSPGGTHLFGTPRQPYFNAGVLRVSLERMRRERAGDRARELLERHAFTLADQDVLNLLFIDRIDALPLTFNVFDSWATVHRGLAALHDPAIVHFAGSEKPWSSTSRSRFAREWRRLYSDAIVEADQVRSGDSASTGVSSLAPPEEPRLAVRPRSAPPGRTGLGSLVRAVLPARARSSTLRLCLGALENAQVRLEKLRASVSPESRPAHSLSWGMAPNPAAIRAEYPRCGDWDPQLDLLLSIPGAGTHALGRAIGGSHPEIRFFPDLFRGVEPGSDGDLEFHGRLDDLLANAQGRCLVPVWLGQVPPTVLGALLTAYRPRLVFLRRAIIFSYISEVWDGSRFGIDSRQASTYAVQCDSWFDSVAELAASLDLPQIWLTFDGLFATGDDARLLEQFYPGGVKLVVPDLVGRPNERSDESVLAVANALAGMSPSVHAQLLRLPGLTGPHLRPARH